MDTLHTIVQRILTNIYGMIIFNPHIKYISSKSIELVYAIIIMLEIKLIFWIYMSCKINTHDLDPKKNASCPVSKLETISTSKYR